VFAQNRERTVTKEKDRRRKEITAQRVTALVENRPQGVGELGKSKNACYGKVREIPLIAINGKESRKT